MLNWLKFRWRWLISAAIFVCVVVLWTWALGGLSTQREICEVTATGKDCESYNILIATAWKIAKATDHWSALITGIATFAVAVFTWTIWRANRNQLRHTREVERAYLVGGGPVTDEQPRKFILDVANYGKTPASPKQFAIEMCEFRELPSKPKYLEPTYERDTLIDEIAPQQKKSICAREVPNFETPIVYGRFWYNDIWKQERYFSFILRVGTRKSVGIGLATHPDLGLIGIDPEYTAWK
jgi:hypothetical protein